MSAPDSKEPENRLFFRIVALSIAVSFGALIASLVALQHDAAGFHFLLDGWSLVSFAVSAVACWFYWNLLMTFRPRTGRSVAARRSNVARVILFTGPLTVIGFIGFLYPLKFVTSPGKKLEVAQGLGLAVAVLSFVGYLLWRVTRFIDPPPPDEDEP